MSEIVEEFNYTLTQNTTPQLFIATQGRGLFSSSTLWSNVSIDE